MHCLSYHAHGKCWGLVMPGPATAHLALQLLIWPCKRSSGIDYNERLNECINKAINFTSPVCAERLGHELQQPIESFNINNKNQTALWEHAHGKQCGPAPQPGHPQQGQLIWKGCQVIWKIHKTNRKKTHLERVQLIIWKSASSSGK